MRTKGQCHLLLDIERLLFHNAKTCETCERIHTTKTDSLGFLESQWYSTVTSLLCILIHISLMSCHTTTVNPFITATEQGKCTTYLQPSMTKTTSLIVTLDSAIFVDKMICENNKSALSMIKFCAKVQHKVHVTNLSQYNKPDKKLSFRKETMRLLCGSVLAKCNWKTIFFGHCSDVIGLQSYWIRWKNAK